MADTICSKPIKTPTQKNNNAINSEVRPNLFNLKIPFQYAIKMNTNTKKNEIIGRYGIVSIKKVETTPSNDKSGNVLIPIIPLIFSD